MTNMEGEFDVVVIGSGAAGLAAALTAGIKGLSVTVLEKAPYFGGASALSGGAMWLPSNGLASAKGMADSAEQARRYFESRLGERSADARIDMFLRRTPEMVQFFQQHTELSFSVARGRPDYHSESPGASSGGRTLVPKPFDGRKLGADIARLRPPLRELTFLGMMIRPGSDLGHFMNVFRSFSSTMYVARRLSRQMLDLVRFGRNMDLMSGNALIARLAKSAFDRGIGIHTSVEAVELLTSDGRVAGVRVKQNGSIREIRARHAVVLATGGFSNDPSRRSQLYPHLRAGGEHWSVAPASITGDGIRLAEKVRGAFYSDGRNAAAWVPVSLVPYRNRPAGVFPHFTDRQKPGFIAVRRDGKRFMNEADSYHDVGGHLLKASHGHADTYCFLIADHRAVRQYGIGIVRPRPVPLYPYIRSGYLTRAATLPELASRIGIDGANFIRTVSEYNESAQMGRDTAFGRGESAWNRCNGDSSQKPNPCVGPLIEAPFYAVKLYMGDLGTFAGIATDPYARVLTQSQAPVPGLYAVGNDMASIMDGDYLGAGSTLGPAMTFGYVAGCCIADEAA